MIIYSGDSGTSGGGESSNEGNKTDCVLIVT